jgi:SanA protein
MHSFFRRVFQLAVFSVFFACLVYGFCQWTVWSVAHEAVTWRTGEPLVAIVLGASVLRDGTPSDILRDRLETAFELYQRGEVRVFLLSGDNGQVDYNEVNAMKQYLLDKHVPPENIFLDHAGFDTYDSLYRAKHIFGVTSAHVVTQTYHLNRALYIGRKLGLVLNGVPADRQPYVKAQWFALRETLANVKAVWDITVGTKPTYLGDPVDVTGDGRVTWGE